MRLEYLLKVAACGAVDRLTGAPDADLPQQFEHDADAGRAWMTGWQHADLLFDGYLRASAQKWFDEAEQ